MNNVLPSEAEKRAQQALELPSLGGLNLVQTRHDITQLLTLIGTGGIFDEYTKHDISHIDGMLALLDWIIPDSTKSVMTPTDWLMIVLASYLHDLGMLVTKEEYSRRSDSAFPAFRDQVLLTNDATGNDYAARLKALPEDTRERFLYQEYVRGCHASRIRNWIRGDLAPQLGMAEGVVNELRRILDPLNNIFRNDLATVCESHHLTDLYDVRKYPVSKPYGPRREENANVQYAAVLLRSIDLLHITSDRTPSIAARLINPADPLGQVEWAKQTAVRAVRDKYGVNDEGELDETAPRNTIEVHATFSDAEGFFGLTSYLSYALLELRKSHDWTVQSNRTLATKHEFPWRYIDTRYVEAQGFETQTFQFTIDQAKILDLLTGHTLYNDSGVVLRELLQNSIDAVRLQYGENSSAAGIVNIKWNSSQRTLEVADNGTGMSQEIIENNFLRVGASRYRDPQFQKEHPEFSPISNFGIGVLSTFMIADEVEVLTCVEGVHEVRELSLRSVHGRYLVRILDKQRDVEAQALGPHGTVVKLTIRPSVRQLDVLELARRWVVIPRCAVSVEIDGAAPIPVGFESAESALEASLRDAGFSVGDTERESKSKVRVIARTRAGVSLAYAVRWNDYFKEWSFLSTESTVRRQEVLYHIGGTCVEGIKVEFTSPGFRSLDRGPIALCDLSGTGAPRTNVARSAIEWASEYEPTLHAIYDLYCEHIVDEIKSLQGKRGHSLTWALKEAGYLVSDLLRGGSLASGWQEATSRSSLERAIMNVPLYAVEVDGKRVGASALDLEQYDHVWSVESAFAEHIEYMLREMPGPLSLGGLLKVLGNYDFLLPEGAILCSSLGRGPSRELIEEKWQISEFLANESQRRCDARWVRVSSAEPLWSSALLNRRSRKVFERIFHGSETGRYMGHMDVGNTIFIPIGSVKATGFVGGENAVSLGGRVYLLPGHPWEGLVTADIESEAVVEMDGISPHLVLSWLLSGQYLTPDPYMTRSAEALIASIRRTEIANVIDLNRYAAISSRNELKVFNTRRWQRRDYYA